MAREILKGGLEQDALTGYKRHVSWRPGERKFAKRKFWKRLRREAKLKVKREAKIKF